MMMSPFVTTTFRHFGRGGGGSLGILRRGGTTVTSSNRNVVVPFFGGVDGSSSSSSGTATTTLRYFSSSSSCTSSLPSSQQQKLPHSSLASAAAAAAAAKRGRGRRGDNYGGDGSSDIDIGIGDKADTKTKSKSKSKISLHVHDMDDTTLILLATMENHLAREELLKRHIMDVDNVSYDEACDTFTDISKRNLEGYYMVALPYKIGIYTATIVGFCTIPLVFHLPTIEWFNEWAVTTDIPEARDLETPLEVSIWSWSWMEPPLGTMSFLLLCSQYARYVRTYGNVYIYIYIYVCVLLFIFVFVCFVVLRIIGHHVPSN